MNKNSPPKISILMYHQVGDFDLKIKNHRATYCHYKRFAAQMAWLKRWDYNVISLDEAATAIAENKSLPKHSVVLTFDDGYENFYEYAWPILQKHNFPSTVYIVSSLLGKTANWLAKDKHPTPPLMNIDRIRQLNKETIVNFGSHSANHNRLAELPLKEAETEILQSKTSLESMLDQPVQDLCYPYGSYNEDVINISRAAGYKTAVTCQRSKADKNSDLLALPRKAISLGDDLAGFWWKVHMK